MGNLALGNPDDNSLNPMNQKFEEEVLGDDMAKENQETEAQNQDIQVQQRKTCRNLTIGIIGLILVVTSITLLVILIPRGGQEGCNFQDPKCQQTLQENNVLKRTFLENHVYDFTSLVENNYNGEITLFSYNFSLVCHSIDNYGFNMTFFLKEIIPQNNDSQIIDFSQNVLKIIEALKGQNVKSRRFLQDSANDSVTDSGFPNLTEPFSKINITFPNMTGPINDGQINYLKNQQDEQNDQYFNENEDGEEFVGNQDQYKDKEEGDQNYQPSEETLIISSLTLINFKLNFTGRIDQVKFGIGLDYNLLKIMNQLLIQIFPLLEIENYDLSGIPKFDQMNTSEGIVSTSRLMKSTGLGNTILNKTTVIENNQQKSFSNVSESNTFDQSGLLILSIVDSLTIQSQASESKNQFEKDDDKLTTTNNHVKQSVTFLNQPFIDENISNVKQIFEMKLMDVMEFEFDYLENQLLPLFNKVMQYSNFTVDNDTCSNSTEEKSLRILNGNQILSLAPFKLLSFSVMGLNIQADISAVCYSTSIGQQDECLIDIMANALGLRYPIMSTGPLKASISQFAKQYQYYRRKIQSTIDIIDKKIVLELKNFTSQLGSISTNIKNLMDPKKYSLYIATLGMLDSFTKLLDNSINDSIGIIETLVLDVLNVANAPREFLKSKFEEIILEKAETVQKNIQFNLEICHTTLDRIQVATWDQGDSLSASNSDISELREIISVCQAFKAQGLNEAETLITQFDSHILKPLKTVNENIDNVVLSFFGKNLDAFDVWENQVKEIVTTFSTQLLETFYVQNYGTASQNSAELKEDTEFEYTVIISELKEIETILSSQIGDKSIGIMNIFNDVVDYYDDYNSFSEASMPSDDTQIIVDYFKQSYIKDAKDKILNLKDQMTVLIQDMKENFLTNLKDINQKLFQFGGSFKQSVNQFKNNIEQIRDSFNNLSLDSLNKISDAVQQIFTTTNEQQTSLTETVNIDFSDLVAFQDRLLVLFDDVGQIKEQFSSILQIEDIYNNFTNDINVFKEYPIQWSASIEQFQIAIRELSAQQIDLSFDYSLLTSLFSEFKDTIIDTVQNNIVEQVKSQGVLIVQQFVNSIKDTLIQIIKDNFKQKLLQSSQNIVKPFLDKILGEFKMGPKNFVFGPGPQEKSITFYFPTPIGYPVLVRFYIGIGAHAQISLQIKGLSFELGAGTGMYLYGGGSGSFGLPYILEIGVSADVKTSFQISLNYRAGIWKQFYSQFDVSRSYQPVTLSMGAFVRHLKIQMYCPFRCRIRWFRRRCLEQNNQFQNTTKIQDMVKQNSVYYYFKEAFQNLEKLEKCNMLGKLDIDMTILGDSQIENKSRRNLWRCCQFIRRVFQVVRRVVVSVVKVVVQNICIPIPTWSDRSYFIGPYTKQL